MANQTVWKLKMFAENCQMSASLSVTPSPFSNFRLQEQISFKIVLLEITSPEILILCVNESTVTADHFCLLRKPHPWACLCLHVLIVLGNLKGELWIRLADVMLWCHNTRSEILIHNSKYRANTKPLGLVVVIDSSFSLHNEWFGLTSPHLWVSVSYF